MSNKPSSEKGTDLMDLNLDGLVKDIKQPSPYSPPDKENNQSSEIPPSPQWDTFISFLNEFKANKASKNRKSQFYIEESVIEVLVGCDINNSSVSNLINGILLSFIEEHKSRFREHLRPLPTLIKE